MSAYGPRSEKVVWRELIGTLRRECLDHVLIFGERHPQRILALYSSYYNQTRTHLALGKDAPLRRSVQRSGTIIATPILFGLHIATRGYDFREGQVPTHRQQLFSHSLRGLHERLGNQNWRPQIFAQSLEARRLIHGRADNREVERCDQLTKAIIPHLASQPP